MRQGSSHRLAPSVYTIPPDLPFLKTLVENILDGTLLPPGFDVSDPFALADITIYLPTKRSTRLLEEAFLAAAQKPGLILPRIWALGEGEEDAHSFDQDQEDETRGMKGEAIPAALSPLTRHLVLTRMVMAWGAAMSGRETATRLSDQPLLIPASPSDAAWLAADLGNLLDRATTEAIDWALLGQLVAEKDLAAFWAMSTQFLEIVTREWPAYLAEKGLIDGADHRDRTLRQAAGRLCRLPGPVIAAGSTGTLPATAEFLAHVAHLPNGVLVLPGFDKSLDAASYAALGGKDERNKAISGHPQYGLKQLLTHYVKIAPQDVRPLGVRHDEQALRSRIVAEAMRPAETTDQWQRFRATIQEAAMQKAFADVALIDAKTDAEEALAIACTLREFVESNQGKACLVTPDRTLARRVALELRRWNLMVDDSAGRPIIKTAPAIVAQLIADCVVEDFDPVVLLALLKHPLATFGLEAGLVRRAARLIDLALLRGPRIAGGVKGLQRRLQNVMDDVQRGLAVTTDVTGGEPIERSQGQAVASSGRLHPAIAGYRESDWQNAEDLVQRLIDIFSPFEDCIAGKEPVLLSEFSRLHAQAFYKIVTDQHIENAAMQAMNMYLAQLVTDEVSASFFLDYRHYPALFRALLGSNTIRQRGEEDPRILILGALEARLLAPDLLILAALDEGSWPKEAETDAFMSRAMQAAMGLEAPERRIGLAAHDICQGLGVRRVVLSRAAKRGGAPALMSRWLQRLLALTGENTADMLRENGARYLAYAQNLDRPVNAFVIPLERPNPVPPVAARPISLSVTRVEQWVRDPYAIYADRILGLKPITPLGAIPGFSDRGTIIHEALDRFNNVWDGVHGEAALARLEEIGAALFDREMSDFPDQRVLWWPRFLLIARAYLNWERARRPVPRRRFSEINTRHVFMVDGQAFTLSATIDRIDLLDDGTLAIIDFKTGQVPTPAKVKSGLNPQLALEVTLFQKGALGEIAELSGRAVSQLGWVKLDGKEEIAPWHSAISQTPDETPDHLGLLAEKQLLALIRQYRNPAQGYLSRPRPDFDFRYVGDYDHLARVKEWQAAEMVDEE